MITTYKTGGSENMGTNELIQEAFGYLNSYKRHRALVDIKKDDKKYHELQMYKMIDRMELALRAINKEVRETNDVE
jgi:ribulose 1,5-bisphosphate carboxylase large subunit-like protein